MANLKQLTKFIIDFYGLKQYKIAKSLEVHPSKFCRYLRGKSELTTKQQKRLIQYLNQFFDIDEYIN